MKRLTWPRLRCRRISKSPESLPTLPEPDIDGLAQRGREQEESDKAEDLAQLEAALRSASCWGERIRLVIASDAVAGSVEHIQRCDEGLEACPEEEAQKLSNRREALALICKMLTRFAEEAAALADSEPAPDLPPSLPGLTDEQWRERLQAAWQAGETSEELVLKKVWKELGRQRYQ